jgi:phosphoribosyl-ATP pyrophosphohydrolase/phosphoribosyl-AMP cyclohydrolase
MIDLAFKPEDVDWNKGGGLVPVVVQDAASLQVLMLGYMNRDALAATAKSGLVTFYSRSKQRLWQKGESSGHVLNLVAIRRDCDRDTLLILAKPQGPTCHLGASSCFGEDAPKR